MDVIAIVVIVFVFISMAIIGWICRDGMSIYKNKYKKEGNNV